MEAGSSAWISPTLLIAALGCVSARFIDAGKNKKLYIFRSALYLLWNLADIDAFVDQFRWIEITT